MNSTPDLRTREDKLKEYLTGEIKGYFFDHLSDAYLKRSGLEYLKEVPVPLTASNMVAAAEGRGLSVSELADNMAVIIGADTHFRHCQAYLKFFAGCFNEKLVDVLTGKGGKLLAAGQFRKACIYFRASLILDPGDKKAVFGYACVCRQWYLSLEGDDEWQQLVAVLKPESKLWFEYTSLLFPDFAECYYFLGYAYLNEGQYIRASVTWKKYISLAADSPEAEEIRERLEGLKDPVIIEEGINELAAGRLEKGLSVLEPYTATNYAKWWPLHYYLASAYRELDHPQEAIEGFRKVIELNPSHVESNAALAELYAEMGDNEQSDKYYNKVKLIEKNNER